MTGVRRILVRAAGGAWLAVTTLAPSVAGGQRATEPARAARLAAMLAEATAQAEAGAAPARMASLRERLAVAPDDRPAALTLARLARLTFDYATADTLTVALDRDGVDAGIRAHALLERALALSARGRVAAAESAFVSAVDAATRAALPDAGRDALVGLARARLRTAGVAAATEALGRAGVPSAPAALARVRCAAAEIAAVAGRADADTLAGAGLALAMLAGDRRTAASCALARLDHFVRAGDMGAAARAATRADSLANAAGDRAAYAASRQGRARLNLLLGYYETAQRYLADALVVADATDQLAVLAQAAADRGDLAQRTGDGRAALQQLMQAEALFGRAGDSTGMGAVHRLRAALAMRVGDLDGAARLLTAERARAARFEDRDAARATAYLSADLALRRRDWPTAQRALDEAGTLTAAHARGWSASVAGARATLALRRGDGATAVTHFTQQLANVARLQWLYRTTVLTELAYARLLTADTAAAARLLTEASDTLDVYRATSSVGTLRLGIAQQAEYGFGGASESRLAVLAAMARSSRAADAYALAERWRAPTLGEALAGRRPAPPAAVQPVRSQAARVPESGELARQLLNDSAAWRQAARVEPPSLDAVRRALPDAGTALLYFMAGGATTPGTVLVVHRAGVQVVALPTGAVVAPAIERLVARIEDGAGDDAAAATLGDAVLGPALATLPADVRRLVLVPDGLLHRAPFAALVVGGRRVADRWAVSVAPSATAALALWARPRDPRPARVLAVGDPALGDAPAADGRVGDAPLAVAVAVDAPRDDAPVPGPALPALPAAAGEARRAATLSAGSVALTGADASEAAFKRLPLARFGVLHFATHAVFDAGGRNGVLALRPGDGEDGFVRASELTARGLAADLVVLSACRSADGALLSGEGVQGFASELLGAGVRAVVGAQWPIGDRAAARFMEHFYGALRHGRTAGEALHDAQRARRGEGATTQEWAAFTLVGDAGVRPAPAQSWWHRGGAGGR